jgi:hypothetical protein
MIISRIKIHMVDGKDGSLFIVCNQKMFQVHLNLSMLIYRIVHLNIKRQILNF